MINKLQRNFVGIKVLLLLVSLGICSLILSSCDDSQKKLVKLQENYQVEMGDDVFNIPVDYLVDSRNRIDASEVKKIKVPPNNRDSRYEPHKYVILMGSLPDVINFKNGRGFSRAPDRTLETIQFNMSYNKGGAYRSLQWYRQPY